MVFLVGLVPLRIADALDDHLLGSLREDSTEAGRVHLHTDLVAHLGVRVVVGTGLGEQDLQIRVAELLHHLAKLEELDLAELIVVTSFDLPVLAVPLSSGLLHRLFEGTDDLTRINALVLGDLVDLSL